MSHWYYCKNGQQLGPIGLDELIGFIESGELSEDTRVWKVGSPEWLRIYKHPELSAAIPRLLEYPAESVKPPARPRSVISTLLSAIGKQPRS